MNRVPEELELGELLDDSFDLKEVTWKIPNALSLPNIVDYTVQSPPFYFSNATWNLELYPFGVTSANSHGYIDLCLTRLDSQIPKHRVLFKIHFQTRRGKRFKRYCDISWFDEDYCTSDVIRYLKKSKFIGMKEVLAPGGVLTVVCQMRVSKIAGINKYSQTPPAVSVSGQVRRRESSNSSASLHVNKILKDLEELFLKQEDCDVVLKVKGKDFPAHMLILKLRSPVFESAVRSKMKMTDTVEIEDCDPSSFSVFLKFLYCGNVENLSLKNVFSLFTTADKYDIQDLKIKCMDFMKKNLRVHTFCKTISLALQHSETELIKLCTDFFATNLQEIILSDKWQVFLSQNPTFSNDLLIKALLPNKNSK